MADLRGATGTRAPPSGSKLLHFHAVFGKNWSNNRLAPPPLRGWNTPSGESWIRHCRRSMMIYRVILCILKSGRSLSNEHFGINWFQKHLSQTEKLIPIAFKKRAEGPHTPKGTREAMKDHIPQREQ